MTLEKRAKRTIWGVSQPTSPTNPGSGDTWYDTTNHQGYLWIDGAWTPLGTASSGEGSDIGSPLMLAGSSYENSLSFDQNGILWSWGSNQFGQVGDNSQNHRSSPVSVVEGGFEFISLGGRTCLALKSDGTPWSWGYNSSGQLGDNSVQNRSSPVSVVGGHSFEQASCGSGHCLAIKADGSAWSWGDNGYGQLGNNTLSVKKSSPISVVGGHSFSFLVAGGNGSVALDENGQSWSWGGNQYGQLGNQSSSSQVSSPVSVIGGYSFSQISSGYYHALGLEDGKVYSWGNGNDGKLGDNTVTHRSSPISVVGDHSFEKIVCGYTCSFGLKVDGSVWSWGDNFYGQLGDNSTQDRSSPVSVVGDHSFTQIAAGNYVIAYKADGSIWSWGRNNYGQLGDGTTLNRSSPVSVVRNFN